MLPGSYTPSSITFITGFIDDLDDDDVNVEECPLLLLDGSPLILFMLVNISDCEVSCSVAW